jgi:hypothetical protein
MDTIKNEWIILFHEIFYTSDCGSGFEYNCLKLRCPICLNIEELYLHRKNSNPIYPNIYCSTCKKWYALRISTVSNTKRSPQEICQENKLRDTCIQCGRDLKQHPSFFSKYMYCNDCCD